MENKTDTLIVDDIDTNKEMMDNIVNSIPGGVAIYKMTDHFETLYFSDGVAELSGYTREEYAQWIKDDATIAIYSEDRKRVTEAAIKVFVNGTSIDETYRIYHKNGSLVWVRLTGVLIGNKDGNPIVHAVFQKSSEMTHLYDNLVNESNSIIYVNDVNNYDLLYINRTGIKILGREQEIYSGKKCYEYLMGLTSPCRFCKMSSMNYNEYIERDFYYPLNDRSYCMRGKLTNWNNITAHVEYINDITQERINQESIIKSQLEMQELHTKTKEAQLRYEVAIKSSGINIWEYDIQKDSLIVISNSPRIKQNCFVIEDYINSTVRNGYVREDSIENFYEIFRKLRNGDSEVSADIWYKTTDEMGWWCERVIYTSIFDDNGQPVKAFGAGKDVTREKQAEEKFHEEVAYREAMQSKNLASIKLNLSSNQVVMGESIFRVVTGLIENGTVDEYFETTAKYIVGIDTQREFNNMFNRKSLINKFNSGEFAVSLQLNRTFDDSQIYWINYTLHLMQNTDTKEIIGYVVSNDITYEKVMQTIMEKVANTDYDFFIVVDGTINSAMDYAVNNSKYAYFRKEQLFETRNEELIHKYVCTEDVDRVIENCKIDNVFKHIQNEEVYKFNFSMTEDNGEVRRKQLQFTLINRDRKTFLMTRIDVNSIFIEQQESQRKLEEALESARKASKVKTDFLSRMSHDMRTPMNGILGLLNLTMDIPDLSQEVRNNLNGIYDSSQYLLGLINDTLDMSKIESNKVILNPQVICVKSILDNIMTYIMPSAKEKGIQIKVIPVNAEFEYIKADPLRLQQIFVNILSNAIKFTPSGGHVEMIIECLKRENGIAHDKIVVRDNGIGISKEFLPKIFEPFEQEQKDIVTNYSGTGLGMSIVKNLVELMNGTIEVKSEQGVGTEVIIYINFERVYIDMVREDNNVFKGRSIADMQVLDKRRILLCEDHLLNAEIATRLLEKKGMIVECAQNGQIAVDMFNESPEYYYDAILMDIRMPVMNGLEAASNIRNLNRTDSKSVPIIAMTANAFDEDVEKSISSGMNAHLAKPIEPDKLYNTLCSYIISH